MHQRHSLAKGRIQHKLAFANFDPPLFTVFEMKGNGPQGCLRLIRCFYE